MNIDHDNNCPVCNGTLKPADMCATDIELGICHAECLEGSPTVYFDTGEPSSGPIHTYRYDSVAESKP